MNSACDSDTKWLIGGIAALISVFGFFYSLGSSYPRTETHQFSEGSEQSTVETRESNRAQEPRSQPSKSNSSNSVFSGFTMSSNGYTWRSAPKSERMSLCRRLANQNSGRYTPEYFYDAFDEFYDSEDPNTLKQSLSEMTTLIGRARR